MIQCPKCSGKGYVKLPPGYPRFHSVTESCSNCNGNGWVSKFEKKSSKNNRFRSVQSEDVLSKEGRCVERRGEAKQGVFGFYS